LGNKRKEYGMAEQHSQKAAKEGIHFFRVFPGKDVKKLAAGNLFKRAKLLDIGILGYPNIN